MVDQANLDEVDTLFRQSSTLRNALDYLATGGRIVQMTIAPLADPSASSPQMPAGVDTTDMEYPAQMVEAIRGELERRRSEINQKLAAFGVTGLT